MIEKIKDFKDLKIWQEGIVLVKEIYKISSKFPKNEEYCLGGQMKRAAISIPSNVAEGFRRKHNKEYIQFLNIAAGSAAELETQIIMANELKYIELSEKNSILEKIDHIGRMITNLRKKLR